MESTVPAATIAEDAAIRKKDSNTLLWVLALVLVGIILFAIFGFNYFQKKAEEQRNPLTAKTIDELHKKNLEGNLNEELGYMYNGFSVVRYDGLWRTDVLFNDKVHKLAMRYGPKEVEQIPIVGELNTSFMQPELYLTFNPHSADKYVALSVAELSINLVQGMGIGVIGACDRNETDACTTRPIVTCDDDEGVIYIINSNETAQPRIEFEDNCVKIVGKGEEVLKAAERFLYMWYKVIPI